MRPSRRVLGWVLILLVGVSGAVAVAIVQTGGGEPLSGGPEPRPGVGVTLVAGRVDSLILSSALLQPVTTPVTIEAQERGAASARVTPVLINGRAESVVWGGGTALTIESAGSGAARGSLILGPAAVDVGPEGIAARLDGVTGRLAPGRYRLVGPVALGAEGLAQPKESVTFETTEETQIVFSGTSVLNLPPDQATIEGPGQIRLVGDVELTGFAADRRASVVEGALAPYRFDLVWVGDRIEVDGRIDGEVTHTPVTEPAPGSGGP